MHCCYGKAETVASLCAARRYFTLFLTEVPSAKIDLNVSTTLRAGVWKTCSEFGEQRKGCISNVIGPRNSKEFDGDFMHFYALQSV